MDLISPMSADSPTTGRRWGPCPAVLEDIRDFVNVEALLYILLICSIGCVSDGPFANLTVNMSVFPFLEPLANPTSGADFLETRRFLQAIFSSHRRKLSKLSS